MEDVIFHHQRPEALNLNTIVSNCWASILHALLMRYIWRAGYFESIVAFSFMRPIHSSYLLGLNLGVTFGVDPHDQMALITSSTDLDKATVAVYTYVGTLTALHLFGFLVSLIAVALSFVWRHIVLELALFGGYLVVSAVFEGAAERLSAFLWFIFTEIAPSVVQFTIRAFSLAKSVFRLVYDIAEKVGTHVARSEVLHRALGKTPYSELPIFRYSAIDPTRQIRLLEIEPMLPWSIPSAKLVAHFIGDDVPPFEAVSFFEPPYLEQNSHPIVLNGCKALIPEQVDALVRRLGRVYRKRVVWIRPICIDDADAIEIDDLSLQLEIAYDRAFRILVWMGEGESIKAAAGMILGLVNTLWKAGMEEAIFYFDRLSAGHCLEMESKLLDGFWEFLDHPWFYDGRNFEEVVGSRQVTFLMDNMSIMSQYMSFVGDVLGALNSHQLQEALERTDKGITWPPAGLDLLIQLSFMRRQRQQKTDPFAWLRLAMEMLDAQRTTQALGEIQ